jgi:hypothetical protein
MSSGDEHKSSRRGRFGFVDPALRGQGGPMEDAIVVPAGLVRSLRRGLLLDLGDAAEHLSVLALQGDGVICDPVAYRAATWALDATRAMLEKVGVVDTGSQSDVELERDDFPFLVFKVLERQHLTEKVRLQDAELDGFAPPTERVESLERFVNLLGRRIARSATLTREARLLDGAHAWGAPDREPFSRARAQARRPVR